MRRKNTKRLAVLSAKLESEYVDALTKVAKVRGITRSQLLREFAANAESLYEFLEAERRRQQSDKLVLDGNLSQWILENMPNGVTSEMLDFLGNVMKHAAEVRRIRETESESRGKQGL
jgi:hypothetical protein